MATNDGLNRFVDTASGGTKGTLGLDAVKRALASGISQSDLIKRANTQGINFGSGASNFLGIKSSAGKSSSGSSSRKNDWKTADYGNTFGSKDIKNLTADGYNNNQILKIAQAAYAGGDVKKVNKLNGKLSGINQQWINPDQSKPTAIWGTKAPNKVFGWNGFGNGLTQYNRDGFIGLGGKYTESQKWSLPTSLMNGFNPAPNPAPEPTPSPNPNPSPGGGGFIPPEPPPEPETLDANQSGAGSDISSFATSWKSRKSLRQRAGRAAQGFASQRTSPANAIGIGTNYG